MTMPSRNVEGLLNEMLSGQAAQISASRLGRREAIPSKQTWPVSAAEQTDFYLDTILSPTWIDETNAFWVAGRHPYDMRGVGRSLRSGLSNPSPGLVSFQQSSFTSPSTTYSSLPGLEPLPCLFTWSSSNTFATSILHLKDEEIRLRFELGRLKERQGEEIKRRRQLLDVLNRRVVAPQVDDTDSSLYDEPNSPLLDFDGIDDNTMDDIFSARPREHAQKYTHLRTIVQPPPRINILAIETAKIKEQEYLIVYDEEDAEQTAEQGYELHGPNQCMNLTSDEQLRSENMEGDSRHESDEDVDGCHDLSEILDAFEEAFQGVHGITR